VTKRHSARVLLLVVAALALGACAGLQRTDSVQVTVAGIEPLPGEGLELRMLVKLRVQNPNDTPLDYDGVYLRLDVQDKTFATGVSDARGSVPRFGEAIIGVPVTASAMRMARQALGVLDGQRVDKFRYDLTGKLSGSGFRAVRFRSRGEFDLPTGASAPADAVNP